MNKINRNIGILIGAGTALSIGTIMAIRLKKKMKKVFEVEEDDFDDIDENSFVKEELVTVKKDMDRIGEVKALAEELESCKEEIISLWEHIEALADVRAGIVDKKGRV